MIYFTCQKNKIHGFPFKVIPPIYDALSYPFPPSWMVAGWIFLDIPQLRHYGSLDSIVTFKTSLLDDLFEIGEKRRSGQAQLNREVVQDQEIRDTLGILCR